MSEFKVTIERIGEISKHSNADTLDVAKLESMDFQFVVKSGQYQVGDKVIYFPVDSLLPDSLCNILGLQGRLSGANKNRVKTIKLRGEISQGVVCPVSVLFPTEPINPEGGRLSLEPNGYDFAQLLNVVKHEPQEHVSCGPQGAMLITLPDGVGVYDLESSQRYKKTIIGSNIFKDEDLFVKFEKLEGTNISFVHNVTEGISDVCSRRHLVKPTEQSTANIYLDAANRLGGFSDLDKVVKALQSHPYALANGLIPKQNVVLRGELIGLGVEGNIYKMKDRAIRYFELSIDGSYVEQGFFISLMKELGLETAPYLGEMTYKEFVETDLVSYSNGKSQLHDTLREGIVIHPMQEHYIGNWRVVVKQRSPEYLVKSDL